MEGLGLLWIIFFVLSVCVTIAPLIIWRNTNRTNRLLALQLAKMQTHPLDVRQAWTGGGSHLPSVPGYEDIGLIGAAKDAVKTFKAAVQEPAPKPAPVPPKNRFCPSCGSDAPLTATICPSCSRTLAESPLYCPKCGHEISHRPAECPGCNVGFKWRETE